MRLRSTVRDMRAVRRSLNKTIWSGAHNLIDRLLIQRPVARIALNAYPLYSSWGGGNQWLRQLVSALRSFGYSVQFSLHGRVDCIIIANSRKSHTVTFGLDDIMEYRVRHPHVPCLHRINDTDKHRDTNHIDDLLSQLNEVAQFTIFISDWVRETACSDHERCKLEILPSFWER